MTDTGPRRRLSAERRREDLLNAAAHAFQAQGYAETTVAAIAAEARASEALAFRYFATKAELYADVVRRQLADHARRRRGALAALPTGTPPQAQLRVITRLYVDLAAEHPHPRAAAAVGAEPPEAMAVRAAQRAADIDELRAILEPSDTRRHEYALRAYLGALEAACAAWVDDGCPPHDREPIVEACLGALEGALGDWAA